MSWKITYKTILFFSSLLKNKEQILQIKKLNENKIEKNIIS
jgi:hypothetical protein